MTVEELQHELTVMIEESIADQYDNPEEADEGSIAADLFASMTYMCEETPEVLAEVARREFGFVPSGSRPDVAAAFNAWCEDEL